MNEKIFISIPSFRDPTLIITIKSAILHADKPDNLVFGIGLQYYDNEMPDLSFLPKENLRTLTYDVDTRPGVVRVRYDIANLYDNEEYLFMIDSHTLFSPSWDTKLIKSLKHAENISGHKDVCISGNGSQEKYDYFQGKKYVYLPLLQELQMFETSSFKKTGDFTLNYHVDCSYFFTYGRYNKEVGLDPYSNFLHEELYMSWRTFMCGWDLYVPAERYARQAPQAYFNLIWGDNNQNRTYTRKETEHKKSDELEMILALAHNKGKFAMPNAKRTVEEFWTFIDSKDSYNNMLISPDLREAFISHNLYHHLVMMA